MQSTDPKKSAAESDTIKILSQLSLNQWPDELACMKPAEWDKSQTAIREKLILQHLQEITHHIELRACFLQGSKGALPISEFNQWYATQIFHTHYLPA